MLGPAASAPATGSTRRARGEAALERTLFVGITAFRWVAWTWMVVTFSIDVRQGDPGSPEAVAHPGAGYVLVLAALAYTVWATLEVRTEAGRLDSAVAVVADLLVAMALVGLDPWVYGSDHSQHLGANWAITSVLAAGVVFAGRGGLVAGAAVGVTRLLGQLLWEPGRWHGDDTLAAVSAIVIYALGGAVAGFFAIKLREAERELAATQAREEVARTLHDGVLQTLAVIQRRSDDPDLRALARDQERDLRLFLTGAARRPDALVPALRSAAATAERRHGLRVEVVAVDEGDDVEAAAVDALAAAVGEALTNAAKHGGARTATVYMETDGAGFFCSVKDDGRGFDPATVVEGMGLARSIRGRIEEVGGRVEVDARRGHGTEVRLLRS